MKIEVVAEDIPAATLQPVIEDTSTVTGASRRQRKGG